MDASTVACVDSLRGVKPHVLQVHLDGGDVRNIAVPAVRRKWSHLKNLLSRMQWCRVEALDVKGNIVQVFDHPEAREEPSASELEDLGDQPSAKVGEQHALLNLMLRGQEVALRHQERLIDTVLANNHKLLEVIAERLTALERARVDDLSMLQEFAHAAAAATAESGDNSSQSEGLIQALAPVLPQLLAAGKANGVPAVAKPKVKK